MSFPVTTVTIWDKLVLETRVSVVRLHEKAISMEQMGKTDNIPSIEQISLEEIQVVRNWSSREAAQEWVDFVLPFDPAHVSIT